MSASKTNTEIFTRFIRRPMLPVPDTGDWDDSLTTAMAAAVSNIDEKDFNLLERHRFSPVDAKRLLALLSWSYARELYSSAEIHSRLRRGDTAELWDNGIPDVEDICQFRSENRRALQACLQVALRFLAAQKVFEGFVTRINESHIAAEASRRIITSVFIDSLEPSALSLL